MSYSVLERILKLYLLLKSLFYFNSFKSYNIFYSFSLFNLIFGLEQERFDKL